MKTSEFKKKLNTLGFYLVDFLYHVEVHGKDIRLTPHATISKEFPNNIVVNTPQIDIAKLCIEYAETPLSEREEEKKYRVRIPDSPERTPVYALCKLVNGCVVINQTNENNFQEHDRYRLTESEIKRNHEYLWQFAKEV